jgi:hypothetical protein
MSQLILTITDEGILNNLLWMLKRFENDGLKIEKRTIEEEKFTQQYLEDNWKELIMTTGDSSDYYKSEQYYEDRVKDYEARGKI